MISYLDSVWRSINSEFINYINGIPDKSMTIQEALDPYREVKCLPKKYLVIEGNKTVQDIAYKTKQITELFSALRKAMEPESVNLPFGIRDRKNIMDFQIIHICYIKNDGHFFVTEAFLFCLVIEIFANHNSVTLQSYKCMRI